MSSILSNLKLGGAGAIDLLTGAVGVKTHLAADVYTDQTAAEQGLGDDAKAALLDKTTAVNDQVVNDAAAATADQVGATLRKYALIGGAVLGATVVVVLVVKLA